MSIFWLKLGAAAIKAVSAVMLLCWKEGNDLAEQWIPAVRGTNQADQTWISDKILDAIIEEARNRKFKGEPTVATLTARAEAAERESGRKDQLIESLSIQLRQRNAELSELREQAQWRKPHDKDEEV